MSNSYEETALKDNTTINSTTDDENIITPISIDNGSIFTSNTVNIAMPSCKTLGMSIHSYATCDIDHNQWQAFGAVDMYHSETEHKEIENILDGWSFKISKKSHSISLIATSDSSSCGMQMSVRALIKKVNVKEKVQFLKEDPKWVYNTTFSSHNYSESQLEKDIELEVFFRSCDKNYTDWFSMFEINQNGICLKINNLSNGSLFEDLQSLNNLVDVLKARVIIEAMC